MIPVTDWLLADKAVTEADCVSATNTEMKRSGIEVRAYAFIKNYRGSLLTKIVIYLPDKQA